MESSGRNLILALLLLGLAASLVSCNNTSRQRSLAVSAAKRFQELYSSGSCGELYDETSQYLQKHETRDRWLRDCDEIRTRFGRLTEFTPESNSAWPIGQVGIVWVKGSAQFEKGIAQVRLDWDLANDRAALYNVLIEAEGEQISLPGFTGEIRR
jgi:hypothetical protein